MEFDYKIQYKQGCDENQAVDALSRSPLVTDLSLIQDCSTVECLTISYPYSTWIDDRRRNIEKDT